MIQTRTAATLTPVLAALGLTACSGSSAPPASDTAAGGSGMTELSISLMDAPVDDVVEVNVEITALWLKAVGNGPAVKLPLEETPYTVNLLDLTADSAALLVDGALITAGEYEWLAMDVNARIDNDLDSYVVTDTGGWFEIFVPSSRVRLVSGFEAPPNEALELLIDWDLRKGLVHPPGLGGYILKPAFRVIDTAAYGRVSGMIEVSTVMLAANECNADVDTPDLDVGNSVYIFAGHGAVPDDVDAETDNGPVATVDAELDDDSTAYAYSTLLPFGEYTVAFTCQSANDESDSDDAGNADPADDTVNFFESAVDITLSATPGATSAVVNF
jgi:hypothetical protein